MLTGPKRWLLNPWAILLGISIGIAVGLTKNPFHVLFRELGAIYLQLLQMCIFPTIVIAVIVSVGNLLHSHITGSLRRLGLVFIIGLILATGFSILGSTLIEHFSLSAQDQIILGEKLAEAQHSLGIVMDTSLNNEDIWSFISSAIATNIFKALSQGSTLPVIIFCIVLGIALGKTKSKKSMITLSALDGVYTALLKLVDWLMYVLPFGLCFVFGGLMSTIGFEVLAPLGGLIVLFLVIGFLFATINLFMLAKRMQCSFFQVLAALKTPLLIALGTASSFAALPTTLQSLEKELCLDRKIIGLLVPIGVNFYQIGSMLKYTLLVVFIAMLYHNQLHWFDYLIIYATGLIMSVAGSGAPSIAVVSMFVVMLDPLGLPVLPGISLLALIDPLIDPFVTMVNIIGNCTATALIIPRKELSKSIALIKEKAAISGIL